VVLLDPAISSSPCPNGVDVLLYVLITSLLTPLSGNQLQTHLRPPLLILGVIMLDLVVWLWRVHRILRMLPLGWACRVRALHMFLGNVFGNVGVCLLSAELLIRVVTLLVRCTDGGG
jgi:hypothetical protein